MNLYLLVRSEGLGYETYTNAIVVAASKIVSDFAG